MKISKDKYLEYVTYKDIEENNYEDIIQDLKRKYKKLQEEMNAKQNLFKEQIKKYAELEQQTQIITPEIEEIQRNYEKQFQVLKDDVIKEKANEVAHLTNQYTLALQKKDKIINEMRASSAIAIEDYNILNKKYTDIKTQHLQASNQTRSSVDEALKNADIEYENAIRELNNKYASVQDELRKKEEYINVTLAALREQHAILLDEEKERVQEVTEAKRLAENKLIESQSDIIDKDEKIKKLNEQLESENIRYQTLLENLEENKKIITDLKNTAREKNDQTLLELRLQISNLTTKIATAQQENDIIQTEMAKITTELDNEKKIVVSEKKKVVVAQEAFNKKKGELDNLLAWKESMENTNEQLKTEIFNITEELKVLNNAKVIMNDSLEESGKKNQELQEQLDIKHRQFTEITNSKKQLVSEIEHLKSNRYSMQRQLEDYKDKANQAEEEYASKLEEIKNNHKQLLLNFQNESHKIENLKANHQQLFNEQQADYNNRIKELQNIHQREINNKVKEVVDKYEEDKLIYEQEYSNKLANLQTEYTKIHTKFTEIDEELKIKNQQLESLMVENNDLKTTIINITEELKAIKDSETILGGSIDEEVRKNAELTGKLNAMQINIQKMEDAKHQLITEISQAKVELQNRAAKIEEFEQRVEDAEEEYRNKLKSINDKHSNELKEVEARLNIEYNKRVKTEQDIELTIKTAEEAKKQIYQDALDQFTQQKKIYEKEFTDKIQNLKDDYEKIIVETQNINAELETKQEQLDAVIRSNATSIANLNSIISDVEHNYNSTKNLLMEEKKNTETLRRNIEDLEQAKIELTSQYKINLENQRSESLREKNAAIAEVIDKLNAAKELTSSEISNAVNKANALHAADLNNKIQVLTNDYTTQINTLNTEINTLKNSNSANKDLLEKEENKTKILSERIESLNQARTALINQYAIDLEQQKKDSLQEKEAAIAELRATLTEIKDSELQEAITSTNALHEANLATKIEELTTKYTEKIDNLHIIIADLQNNDITIKELLKNEELKNANLQQAINEMEDAKFKLTTQYECNLANHKKISDQEKEKAINKIRAQLNAVIEAKPAEIQEAVNNAAAEHEVTLNAKLAELTNDYASKMDELNNIITDLKNNDISTRDLLKKEEEKNEELIKNLDALEQSKINVMAQYEIDLEKQRQRSVKDKEIAISNLRATLTEAKVSELEQAINNANTLHEMDLKSKIETINNEYALKISELNTRIVSLQNNDKVITDLLKKEKTQTKKLMQNIAALEKTKSELTEKYQQDLEKQRKKSSKEKETAIAELRAKLNETNISKSSEIEKAITNAKTLYEVDLGDKLQAMTVEYTLRINKLNNIISKLRDDELITADLLKQERSKNSTLKQDIENLEKTKISLTKQYNIDLNKQKQDSMKDKDSAIAKLRERLIAAAGSKDAEVQDALNHATTLHQAELEARLQALNTEYTMKMDRLNNIIVALRNDDANTKALLTKEVENTKKLKQDIVSLEQAKSTLQVQYKMDLDKQKKDILKEKDSAIAKLRTKITNVTASKSSDIQEAENNLKVLHDAELEAKLQALNQDYIIKMQKLNDTIKKLESEKIASVFAHNTDIDRYKLTNREYKTLLEMRAKHGKPVILSDDDNFEDATDTVDPSMSAEARELISVKRTAAQKQANFNNDDDQSTLSIETSASAIINRTANKRAKTKSSKTGSTSSSMMASTISKTSSSKTVKTSTNPKLVPKKTEAPEQSLFSSMEGMCKSLLSPLSSIMSTPDEDLTMIEEGDANKGAIKKRKKPDEKELSTRLSLYRKLDPNSSSKTMNRKLTSNIDDIMEELTAYGPNILSKDDFNRLSNPENVDYSSAIIDRVTHIMSKALDDDNKPVNIIFQKLFKAPVEEQKNYIPANPTRCIFYDTFYDSWFFCLSLKSHNENVVIIYLPAGERTIDPRQLNLTTVLNILRPPNSTLKVKDVKLNTIVQKGFSGIHSIMELYYNIKHPKDLDFKNYTPLKDPKAIQRVYNTIRLNQLAIFCRKEDRAVQNVSVASSTTSTAPRLNAKKLKVLNN